jgi:Excalibur calcium-binding domain
MARVGAGSTSDDMPVHLALVAFLGICVAGDAAAHGGRLNKEGCHNDRRRGGYHCHRGGSAASRNASAAYDFTPSQRRPARAAPGAGAYANCSQARAAGAAPVRRGDPGYGSHLDRDGDGVGCEPRRR